MHDPYRPGDAELVDMPESDQAAPAIGWIIFSWSLAACLLVLTVSFPGIFTSFEDVFTRFTTEPLPPMTSLILKTQYAWGIAPVLAGLCACGFSVPRLRRKWQGTRLKRLTVAWFVLVITLFLIAMVSMGVLICSHHPEGRICWKPSYP